MVIQLYIHFPFCKSKCYYCDFCSFPKDAQTVAAYCAALENEIRLAGARFADAEVSTVYLGGGTPSIVPADCMDAVLAALGRHFSLLPDAEFTTEANPGTLAREWLDMAAAHGVNRLSLGMQAAQDGLLKGLGRIHTHAQTCEAVALSRQAGIEDLNLDLMYALPGQTERDYLDSVDAACALAPTHVSAYSLIVEEHTPLFDSVCRGEVCVPDDDAAAQMSAMGAKRLEEHGYRQYEISNYARDGWRCRHNVGYWQGAWYLGLGLNAHGMLPPTEAEREAGACYARQRNTDGLDEYIRKNGDAVAQRQTIGADDAMFETVMLGLRMTDGISESDFAARHGVTLDAHYGAACRSLVADGLALWQNGRFRLTTRGLMLQNTALMRFMA